MKHFASTSTSAEVSTYFYTLEFSSNHDNRRLTDMFFFKMGDSNSLLFFYDCIERSSGVKFSLLMQRLFGNQFCNAWSQTWTFVSVSILTSVFRLAIAMAASYLDLFKDIFFAHLVYAATLESSSNIWDMNSVPVVVFWSTIGSILISEIAKLIVLLGSPEFQKWYRG